MQCRAWRIPRIAPLPPAPTLHASMRLHWHARPHVHPYAHTCTPFMQRVPTCFGITCIHMEL